MSRSSLCSFGLGFDCLPVADIYLSYKTSPLCFSPLLLSVMLLGPDLVLLSHCSRDKILKNAETEYPCIPKIHFATRPFLQKTF